MTSKRSGTWLEIALVTLALVWPGASHATLWTLKAPCDHFSDDPCQIELTVESGKPMRPGVPTILVVTDGQQFSARPGGAERMQRTLLGEDFNVVMYWGRSNSNELLNRVSRENVVDWVKAYQLLGARQWIGDIHIVRKFLEKEHGKVGLFGTSGGAYLIHQYLSSHPSDPIKAFTSAPVSPEVTSELGVLTDHFEEQLDSETRAKLSRVLQSGSVPRPVVAKLLQRQHFFVSPDKIVQERALLLNALADGDSPKINRYLDQYQLNAIDSMMASEAGIPIRVRLFEFVAHLPDQVLKRCKIICPDLEQQLNTAMPLLAHRSALQRSLVKSDRKTRTGNKSEIFVLLGRYDHTVDYRAGIALAMQYPNSTLFIADSDHVFSSLKDTGVYKLLIRRFFLGEGVLSQQDQDKVISAIWKE